jgi:uncharacterized protein (TIGR03437 family)
MGIYFVSTGQINAVIPPNLRGGPATITVHSGSATVGPLAVNIVPVAPAFFTANQNGKGIPAARVITNTASGGQVADLVFQCTGSAGTCTPKPINVSGAGETVALELYGTGLRGHSSNISAIVGTTPVQVTFAGAQSQYAGLDQVDVLLPKSLAGSGTVNLIFTADGVNSNTLTINIQ